MKPTDKKTTVNIREHIYEIVGPSGENTGYANLTEDEHNIIIALNKLDALWKNYKSKPGGNNLILFCGSGCTVRWKTPSANAVIEELPNITCDGGDGADVF